MATRTSAKKVATKPSKPGATAIKVVKRVGKPAGNGSIRVKTIATAAARKKSAPAAKRVHFAAATASISASTATSTRPTAVRNGKRNRTKGQSRHTGSDSEGDEVCSLLTSDEDAKANDDDVYSSSDDDDEREHESGMNAFSDSEDEYEETTRGATQSVGKGKAKTGSSHVSSSSGTKDAACEVLCLRFLPPQFEEPQLFKFLGQFGAEVLNCFCVRSRRTHQSKGIAYVQFDDPDIIDTLVEECHGMLLGGQAVQARRALLHRALPSKEQVMRRRKLGYAYKTKGAPLKQHSVMNKSRVGVLVKAARTEKENNAYLKKMGIDFACHDFARQLQSIPRHLLTRKVRGVGPRITDSVTTAITSHVDCGKDNHNNAEIRDGAKDAHETSTIGHEESVGVHRVDAPVSSSSVSPSVDDGNDTAGAKELAEATTTTVAKRRRVGRGKQQTAAQDDPVREMGSDYETNRPAEHADAEQPNEQHNKCPAASAPKGRKALQPRKKTAAPKLKAARRPRQATSAAATVTRAKKAATSARKTR